MKKLLLIGAAVAVAVSTSKRRKSGAKADSARLWSEAVEQPSGS